LPSHLELRYDSPGLAGESASGGQRRASTLPFLPQLQDPDSAWPLKQPLIMPRKYPEHQSLRRPCDMPGSSRWLGRPVNGAVRSNRRPFNAARCVHSLAYGTCIRSWPCGRRVADWQDPAIRLPGCTGRQAFPSRSCAARHSGAALSTCRGLKPAAHQLAQP
jgi:hypothetical protein